MTISEKYWTALPTLNNEEYLMLQVFILRLSSESRILHRLFANLFIEKLSANPGTKQGHASESQEVRVPGITIKINQR